MDDFSRNSAWWELDVSLSFEDKNLESLLSFWNSIYRFHSLPRRADFTPTDIQQNLGWVMLIDVEPAPLRFRFRLVGSGVTGALSRDATRRYMDELYDPEIYDEAVSPYVYVVKHRRPVRSVGRMVHANKSHIRYEAVYLPYSDDGERVDLIMEGVRYEGIS